MITSLPIRSAISSGTRGSMRAPAPTLLTLVARGGCTGGQERLNAASRIVGVEQRNGGVEQESICSRHTVLEVGACKLLDDTECEGGAVRKRSGERLGGL